MTRTFLKIFSVLLCLTLLMSNFDVLSFAEQDSTSVVFLDGTSGSDENDGQSYSTAVASMQKAYEILLAKQDCIKTNANANGIIVVCGVTVQNSHFANTSQTALEHVGTVIYTSNYGGIDYAAQNGAKLNLKSPTTSELRIGMGGPTVFTKVTVTLSGTKSSVTIYGASSLTIENDAVFDTNLTNKKMYLRGGYAYKVMEQDTTMIINSGTFSFVSPTNAESASAGNFFVTVGGNALVDRLVAGQTNSAGGTTQNSTVTVCDSATVQDFYICGDTGVTNDSKVIISGANATITKMSSRRSGKSGTAVDFTLVLNENYVIPENLIAAISGKNFKGQRNLVIGNCNDTDISVDSVWNTLRVADNSNVTFTSVLSEETALIVDGGSVVKLAEGDNHTFSGDGNVVYVHEHNWVKDNQNSIEPNCTTKGKDVYICNISGCAATKAEDLGYRHNFVNDVCTLCGGKSDTVYVTSNGTGDGYTVAGAVGSLEQAYELLLNNSNVATDPLASGKIIICGTLKINEHFNYYGKILHKGTVTISGNDDNAKLHIWAKEKLDLTPNDEHRIQFGGPTVIENLTIDRSGESEAVSLTLFASNNLVIKESVKVINTNWESTYTPPQEALSDQEISSIVLSAHRGYQPMGPENSILSFTAAGQLGFDYVECDVYQTLDGELITIHDSTLDRTTNGSGNVMNMTYEQILQYRIDTAAYGFNLSTADSDDLYVPTFKEYLQILKQYGAKPFIEIKDSRQDTIEKTIDMALEYFESDEIVMSCTSLAPLKTSYAYNNDVFHHLIWGDTSDSGYTNSINELSDMVNSSGQINAGIAFNITNIHIDSNFNTAKSWIDKAHNAGLKVCLRGADDMVQVRKMFELGLDYYPTNTTSPQSLTELKNFIPGGYVFGSASGGKIFVRGGSRNAVTTEDIDITLLGGIYDFVSPTNATKQSTGNYSVTVGKNVFISRLIAGETATSSQGDRASSVVTIKDDATIKNLYIAGDTANTKQVTVNILGGKVESIAENRSKSGTAENLIITLASPLNLPKSISISNSSLISGTKVLTLNGTGELKNSDIFDKLIANDGAVITLVGTYPEQLESVGSGKFILPTPQPAKQFAYTQNGSEITITGYLGTDKQVVIPAELDGYPVTQIGENSFYLNRSITSVTIPGSVKTISENAFRGCTALEEIVFNEGLQSIGTYAFGGTKLTKVVFPSTLKTIGVSAFNGCSSLTEIDLANIESIKGSAFANCAALGSTGAGNRVVIPATVTELGAHAFLNCAQLKRVDWYPVKLSSGAAGSMENPAFKGCTGITLARIYQTAENIPAYLFYKASDVANNKGITTLSFMAGSRAKTIGDYAFYQQRIGKVVFPDTITKIGVESFRNNNMLKVLTFGKGEQTIGQLAFSFCNNLPAVTIPGNVKTIYAYAFRGCAKLETVVVEEGVDYISSYAFGFTALKSITLPASITRINSGLTYPTSATIHYPAGSYVDKYLHSSAARITNETLVCIGE
ncbi:MAG: leucine-rich repeat protein [Clostridia bacterium]|nr:leucine-rich repeat protein [Clostridia bacterium]